MPPNKPAAPSPLRVAVERLAHGRDLPLPVLHSTGAAGLDLHAAIGVEPVVLGPGARALVPTGLALALPDGHEAQIRPRSGLAAKHGLTVLNSPGTIDSDYRGEIKIILINLGTEDFAIVHGARIAQMVIHKVEQATLFEVEALPQTARGAGGFGSSGSGG